MDWYKKANILEDLYSGPYQGTCYHGSYVEHGENLFNDLTDDYSDWEAVWVTPDQDVAKEFAASRGGDIGTPIVFQIKVKLDNMATITQSDSREMHDELDLYTLQEAIPYLRQYGYDSWHTMGSMGYHGYEDIAVFGGSLHIESVSLWDGR